jgi:hypothetical protein
VSQQIPTYSFLPWLRIGVANNISQPDGAAGVHVRATFPLDLAVTGTKLDGGASNPPPVHKDLSLYGPGDVVGIESKAVIKVDPRHGITNFEPNFLPYIDFYEEDFPWRYTPAAADHAAHRLRPWIALVVLKDEEFDEGLNVKDKPLPFFELTGVVPDDVFPEPSQLWAWAHVHVNKDLTAGDPSMPAVLSRFQATLNANPDHAYSRIICPRRLEPKVRYTAFLIPTFETGRLAGLGEEIPPTTVATASAWSAGQTSFPYYYRWSFVTGTQGDFEFLVKLLKPQPADKRVGVRDIDVLHPGSALPPINLPAELGGVLKLGGALRVPFDTLPEPDQDEVRKYDEWDENPYPHPFEQAMAARVNLFDDYTRARPEDVNPDGDPDPVITSPLYGRWHALVDRLLKAADGADLPNPRNWVHELNLDPRFRTAAGLGTKVVQQNQEEYMNAAWEQVGDVLAANNQLKLGEFSLHVSHFVYQKGLLTLSTPKVLVMTAPVQRRVVTQGLTVHGQVLGSVVPAAAFSAPFRKITRPGAAVMKRLGIATTEDSVRFVPGINDGRLLPVPPKLPPPGAIKLSDAAEALDPVVPAPPPVRQTLWLILFVVALALLLLVLLLAPGLVLLLLVLAALALVLLLLWLFATRPGAPKEPAVGEGKQTPGYVDSLPKVTNFVVSAPADNFVPQFGAADSAEGVRFKTALRDAYTYTTVRFPEPVKRRLDLDAIATATLNALDPAVSIPKRVLSAVKLPLRIVEEMVETFTPVMAYPVLDFPMYKPLSALSSELFLPNINLIPPNSITLLESNQRFIESYMVGLNHEMARELLWREYPTDQRGSCFRQFWDVSSVIASEAPTPAERDQLRDIPRIHLWSKFSELGRHNQRDPEGDPTQLVLVIRGELLKKYPTAVIYAQKADWGTKDGVPSTDVDRVLVPLTAAEEEADPPDPSKLLKPLFEAKVDPDIYFLGFNLDDEQARGGDTVEDDAGWFFVIKERPGEARFGFDYVEGSAVPRLINWNNLTWNHVGTPDGRCIELDQTITFDAYDEPQDQENRPNPDDAQAQWEPGTNSAELAYILYQVPVLVAVHASRMLP